MTTRNKFSPEVREREVRMVELKCELSLWPAPTRCIASIGMRSPGSSPSGSAHLHSKPHRDGDLEIYRQALHTAVPQTR